VVNVDIAKQWSDRLWTLLDFKHIKNKSKATFEIEKC
jgi:hypothetical protein